MVQIIQENRRPKFSEKLLGGFQAGVNEAVPIAERFAENVALKKKGIDVANLSGNARDIAIHEGMKRASLIEQGRNTLNPTSGQSEMAPGSNPGAEEASPSRASQYKQTSGPSQVKPSGPGKIIVPPEQIESEANRRAREKLNRGQPTDLQTEIGLIQQENSNVAQYQAYQQQVGDTAAKYLTQALGEDNVTPELSSLFQKKGEEYALQGLTQAEINKNLALESKKLANQVNSLKQIQGSRIYHKIGQAVTGEGRKAEKVRESIRVKAKPLLDLGLYDTVRSELSNKNYGPEEIETIISQLGEQTKKSILGFEKVKPPRYTVVQSQSDPTSPTYRSYKNNPDGQKVFADNLQKTLSSDPSVNLILLRKAYEDKGVDWDTFKTEFNNMVQNGQFEPNDDQLKMMDYLEEPPLNRLQKILYNLNLRGR